MAATPPPTALQTDLNRVTPGTARAKLGDVIYDLVAKHNAAMAALDAADIAGNFVANFQVATPEQR
jgi:hypothetical protein